MGTKLRITFNAEGHFSDGRKAVISEVCGSVWDELIIDSDRWYRCNTAQEQEAILLGTARNRYPEVNWEYASYIEIKQA